MPRSSRFGRLGEGWGEDVERSEATRPRDARTVAGWLWVPAGTGTGGTGTPWRVPECGYTAVGARHGGPHLFDGGPWDLTAFDGGPSRILYSDIEMVGAHVGAIPRDELRERGAPTSGQLKVIR